VYERGDIARQGAFLVYTDFIHAVTIIFDPKFLWKYELYIQGLYQAYGADQAVMLRKVRFKEKCCSFPFLSVLLLCFDYSGCHVSPERDGARQEPRDSPVRNILFEYLVLVTSI